MGVAGDKGLACNVRRLRRQQPPHLGVGSHVRRCGFRDPGRSCKHQRADEVGPANGKPRGDGRAHRDAADNDRRQPEPFDQRREIVGEGGDGKIRPGIGSAMSAAFECDHAKAGIVREGLGGLADIAAQPVLEDDRHAVAAGIMDGKRQAVADKGAASEPLAVHIRRPRRKAETPGASSAESPCATRSPSKPAWRRQRI